jgi:hypothetical protein
MSRGLHGVSFQMIFRHSRVPCLTGLPSTNKIRHRVHATVFRRRPASLHQRRYKSRKIATYLALPIENISHVDDRIAGVGGMLCEAQRDLRRGRRNRRRVWATNQVGHFSYLPVVGFRQ